MVRKIVVLGTLVFLLLGCSQLKYRDEAEKYRAALSWYEAGEYRQALPVLLEFSKKDDYQPLYETIAHCYYELNISDSCLFWLEKSESYGKTNIENAIGAAELHIEKRKDKLTFLQFLKMVGVRNNLDYELLLSLIETESAYQNEKVSAFGAVGLMQLVPETAKAYGLVIDNNGDERYNSAKNIEVGAAYLSDLLEHFKDGGKKTNLKKALSAYLCGFEQKEAAETYFTKVAECYRKYRDNDAEQVKAEEFFYAQNKNSLFELVRQDQTPEQAEKYKTYLQQAKKAVPEFYSETKRAYIYNNLAVIAHAFCAEADTLYEKALSYAPADCTINYNYALFLYENGNGQKAADYFSKALSLPKLAAEANRYLAILNIEKGDFATAQEQLAHYGKDAYLQGLISYGLGDEKAAESYFNEALSTDEALSASALLTLAYKREIDETAIIRIGEYHPLFRHREREFILPVDNFCVNSRYGWRPNPLLRDWTERLQSMDYHYGNDIPVPQGSPVYAVADGVITESKRYPKAGEAIFVKHNNGFNSAYFHLLKRSKSKGEIVNQGDIIGYVGSTGASSGPHLHFGLYDENMEALNPLLYLPFFSLGERRDKHGFAF